ncbi:helix-turn-helix domain-containing protein [Streptomyces albidoflavus]
MSDNEAGAEARDGGAERAAGQSGKAAGSQTLARGLLALELVAGRPRGLAVQDLAQHLGVHRTIAYRILVTLAEHHLVVRASDGRYRAGSGTVTLARGYTAGGARPRCRCCGVRRSSSARRSRWSRRRGTRPSP